MKVYRIPTCLILKYPNRFKHLIGKWFWDRAEKCFVKGDKTPKQKKKELEKMRGE